MLYSPRRYSQFRSNTVLILFDLNHSYFAIRLFGVKLLSIKGNTSCICFTLKDYWEKEGIMLFETQFNSF